MAYGWRSTQDLRANAVDLVSNFNVIYLISRRRIAVNLLWSKRMHTNVARTRTPQGPSPRSCSRNAITKIVIATSAIFPAQGRRSIPQAFASSKFSSLNEPAGTKPRRDAADRVC